jgi:hypothetical protein
MIPDVDFRAEEALLARHDLGALRGRIDRALRVRRMLVRGGVAVLLSMLSTHARSSSTTRRSRPRRPRRPSPRR